MFNFKKGRTVSCVMFGKVFDFKIPGHLVACFTFTNVFLTFKNIKLILKNKRY
jgi:hypothetical protein